MVHYRTDEYHSPRPSAQSHRSRDYWKLSNIADLEHPAPYSAVSYHGYLQHARSREKDDHFKHHGKYAPSRYRQLVGRAERGLIIYDPLSIEQLSVFIASRHLGTPAPAADSAHTLPISISSLTLESKGPLIDLLETADVTLTFPLGRLPAELRLEVYRFHFHELDTSTTIPIMPTQPPLTQVSRRIRKESLPLFYTICTFHLTLELQGYSLRSAGCNPYFSKDAFNFLAARNALQIKSIRNFAIHLKVRGAGASPPHSRREAYRLDFAISISEKGTLSALPTLTRDHGAATWENISRGSKISQMGSGRLECYLQRLYQRISKRQIKMENLQKAGGGERCGGEDGLVKPGLRLKWTDLKWFQLR